MRNYPRPATCKWCCKNSKQASCKCIITSKLFGITDFSAVIFGVTFWLNGQFFEEEWSREVFVHYHFTSRFVAIGFLWLHVYQGYISPFVSSQLTTECFDWNSVFDFVVDHNWKSARIHNTFLTQEHQPQLRRNNNLNT